MGGELSSWGSLAGSRYGGQRAPPRHCEIWHASRLSSRVNQDLPKEPLCGMPGEPLTPKFQTSLSTGLPGTGASLSRCRYRVIPLDRVGAIPIPEDTF